MNIEEYQSIHEQKSHFENSLCYNTYLCSIPLDFSQVPMHWHDEIEFIYIKKGEGIISLNLIEYTVTAGDIIMILPGMIHGIFQKEASAMEYENIIFSTQLFDTKDDNFYSNYLEPFFDNQVSIPSVYRNGVSGYESVKRYLDSNDNISMDRTGPWGLAIKGNLFLLFFALISLYEHKDKPINDSRINVLKPVIKFVELHYNTKITVAQMAKLTGFSESHFMRYFKEVIGESFITYLNNYRLTIAARLLITSKESILTISQQAGFDNLSYFNRAFKKKYNKTPREYRN